MQGAFLPTMVEGVNFEELLKALIVNEPKYEGLSARFACKILTNIVTAIMVAILI